MKKNFPDNIFEIVESFATKYMSYLYTNNKLNPWMVGLTIESISMIPIIVTGTIATAPIIAFFTFGLNSTINFGVYELIAKSKVAYKSRATTAERKLAESESRVPKPQLNSLEQKKSTQELINQQLTATKAKIEKLNLNLSTHRDRGECIAEEERKEKVLEILLDSLGKEEYTPEFIEQQIKENENKKPDIHRGNPADQHTDFENLNIKIQKLKTLKEFLVNPNEAKLNNLVTQIADRKNNLDPNALKTWENSR